MTTKVNIKKGTIAEMVASIPDNDPMRNPPASQMSLRDYFAAHAFAQAHFVVSNIKLASTLAYETADAMLAERLKVK